MLPFLRRWSVAYPTPSGCWTLAGPGQRWGVLNPETGDERVVDAKADAALPALANAVGRGELLAYRMGRRAVVALGHPGSMARGYVKVVRPSRLDGLVNKHQRLAGLEAVAVPRVVDADPSGWVELSPVPGRSLLDHLAAGGGDLISSVAGALARFHHHLDVTGIDEVGLGEVGPDNSERWVRIVERAEPSVAPVYRDGLSALPSLDVAGNRSVVHRDLHDKNILLDRRGTGPPAVGLIDLDGIGVGYAEDDIANLIVHFELRRLQRGDDEIDRTGWNLIAAYVEQSPLDLDRLDAIRRHTWFRLSCLYRFRRSGRHLVTEMLRRATSD